MATGAAIKWPEFSSHGRGDSILGFASKVCYMSCWECREREGGWPRAW
jgi:hypothetical protein